MLCSSLLIHCMRAAQMIYFVFVASVLVAQNGAVLELTGHTPRVIYGQLDSSDAHADALTLTRNTSEDKLVFSGEFEINHDRRSLQVWLAQHRRQD